MLLRTEELGHVPLFQFKTLSQFKITAGKNSLPLFSFWDFKYRKLSNQDLHVENHLLCTNDNELPQIMSRGSSDFSHRSSLPTTSSTFYLRWQGMMEHDSPRWSRFRRVDVHTDVATKANTHVSYWSNNTGHEIALEEVSSSSFLAKGNTKIAQKTNTHTNKQQQKNLGEAPLAMISIQRETERERFFRHSSWLTWMISNTPSSAKGTHILSVYKSYSGIPYMGVFPTNIKEISWGHGVTKKKSIRNTHFGSMCTFFFFFKGQSI